MTVRRCADCGTERGELHLDDSGDTLCRGCLVRRPGPRVDEPIVEDEPAGGKRADRASGGRALHVEAFAGVVVRRARWAWEGRVPLGALSLLAGRQGLGKSTLTIELAARVSRGDLPGDLHGEAAGVLIVTLEDAAGAVVKPRLMAAGADLDRVHHVHATVDGLDALVTFPADAEEIERAAVEHGARLLIVDPLTAALPGELDSHRDAALRRALAPLAALAERCDLAALVVAHLNKAPGSDPLYRVGGSVAMTAAPRSVLIVGAPDLDAPDRVLAHAKCNYGALAPALAARIEGRELPLDGETLSTSRWVACGESDLTVHDLFGAATEEQSELDEAAGFLRDALADGEWHAKADLVGDAGRERIAARTLQRAAQVLHVEYSREGFPARSSWRLPAAAHSRASDLGATGVGATGATGENPAVEPNLNGHAFQSRQGREAGATGDDGTSGGPSGLLADLLADGPVHELHLAEALGLDVRTTRRLLAGTAGARPVGDGSRWSYEASP